MKIKVLLLAVGCFLGALNANAQKGVNNGTPFGSGEDSVRCITNISLFVSYAKAGNLKDAEEFWQIAYRECPGSVKDIYLYGTRIIGGKITQETDATKKKALINELMELYDNRVKYFGNDKRYGKDWVVSRKAQDYIQYMGDKADPKLLYGWLKEVVTEFGDNTETLAVSLYMYSSHQLLALDENHKATYIQDYLKSSGILDKQLAEAKEVNNEKDITAISSLKTGVDNGFASSGAADCETLQNLYASKVEANKENLPFLRETISLFRRMRCQEIEAYFAAAEYAHKQEPTAESAIGLGKQAVRKKDYNSAITLFEEAATMETEADSKADIYYMIALLSFEQNSYSKARQYCQRAIDVKPNYGAPYLLIGKMYASTAGSIYPDDNVLKKTVYYAAVDKFERARQVDPSVADDAAALIHSYRAHFPSTEDIFMHPDLTKGKSITIGGWIGERTTVR